MENQDINVKRKTKPSDNLVKAFGNEIKKGGSLNDEIEHFEKGDSGICLECNGSTSNRPSCPICNGSPLNC